MCASHDTSDLGQVPSLTFITCLLTRNREPEKIVTNILISVSPLKQKKFAFQISFSVFLRLLEFFLTHSESGISNFPLKLKFDIFFCKYLTAVAKNEDLGQCKQLVCAFCHHSLIDSWFKVLFNWLITACVRSLHCFVTKQSKWVCKLYCAKLGTFLEALSKAEKESSWGNKWVKCWDVSSQRHDKRPTAIGVCFPSLS